MTHKSTKEVEVWRRGGVENEVCGEITHLAVTQGGPMFVGAPILNTNQSTFSTRTHIRRKVRMERNDFFHSIGIYSQRLREE